jgi:LacI family transcriptional regulator
VAVFADWDNTAFRTLEICAEAGIDVPGRVSILGTDNDEVLCRGVEPALSSILPDHVGLGFRVAQELERRMNGGRPQLVILKASVREILTRDSTRTPQPAEHLIRLALRFIAENDTRNLTPTDVVAHLGVSRSLADLRFREIENTSIRQAIEDRRMNIAEKAMSETNRPIRQVARESGYRNIKTFEAAFRRRYGTTPGAFRRKN